MSVKLSHRYRTRVAMMTRRCALCHLPACLVCGECRNADCGGHNCLAVGCTTPTCGRNTIICDGTLNPKAGCPGCKQILEQSGNANARS